MTAPAELSNSFDLDGLQDFLERLQKHVVGLDGLDVVTLVEAIADMEPQSEREWLIDVFEDGESSKLLVHVFMDDEDAPDVSFLGPEPLIHQLTEQLKAFYEAAQP